MKKIIYFFGFALLFIIINYIAGCATVPYKEVREAERSVQRARKIEAPVYAPEAFLEAQGKLLEARYKMSAEQYGDAKSLAQRAKKLGDRAYEESLDARKNMRRETERLLLRGEAIWNKYQQGEAKRYVPQKLLEIKDVLNKGRKYLEDEQYMDARDAAQTSLQMLAAVPELIEKKKLMQLGDAELVATKKDAENIIKQARLKAYQIVESAKKEAKEILIEAKIKAARARLEELEIIYPSTYKVKKGETLMDIARRKEIYNDPYMWPLIYKGNRDQIRDPKVVFPGQVLSIPRDITFQEIIQARKEAHAPAPYIPPFDAYKPEFYRRYLLVVPENEKKDASKQ